MAFGFLAEVAMSWPPVRAEAMRTSERIPPPRGIFGMMVMSWGLVLSHSRERWQEQCARRRKDSQRTIPESGEDFSFLLCQNALGIRAGDGTGAGLEIGQPTPPGSLEAAWRITHPRGWVCTVAQYGFSHPVQSAHPGHGHRKKFLLYLCPPGQSNPLGEAMDYCNFSFLIIL